MGLEKKKLHQHLGSFLKHKSHSNIEISIKTGIDPTRISKIIKPDKDTLTADEFYLISLAIDADIDEMSEAVFKDYLLNTVEPNAKEKTTKFGEYLSTALVTQKDISDRTSVSAYRISALTNDSKTVLLAKEVYLIAKAVGRRPSEAFSFLCGHLRIRSVKEQDILRAKYKNASKGKKT